MPRKKFVDPIKFYERMRFAESHAKTARVMFLEASGWHMLPNGVWIHDDDRKLIRQAQAAATAERLETDGYERICDMQQLALTAEQACAVAAHRLLTRLVSEYIEHAAEDGKHQWQAVGSAGDAADMTVYRCHKCGKHRTTNGPPAIEGCTGRTHAHA